jgi:hypothetical protein
VGQVCQDEVDERGAQGVLRLPRCMLLRVYSSCVALMAMLSRVYSPRVRDERLDRAAEQELPAFAETESEPAGAFISCLLLQASAASGLRRAGAEPCSSARARCWGVAPPCHVVACVLACMFPQGQLGLARPVRHPAAG